MGIPLLLGFSMPGVGVATCKSKPELNLAGHFAQQEVSCLASIYQVGSQSGLCFQQHASCSGQCFPRYLHNPWYCSYIRVCIYGVSSHSIYQLEECNDQRQRTYYTTFFECRDQSIIKLLTSPLSVSLGVRLVISKLIITYLLKEVASKAGLVQSLYLI